MRIAVVSPSFLPIVGGMEWKVHHLAAEYTRRGHSVTVFASRPRVTLSPIPLSIEHEYRVERCGFPLRGMDRLGISRWLFRRAVLREHRGRSFDVLHCHHLGLPTRFGADVRARTQVPVVSTTCGGDVMVLPEIGYGDRLKPRFDRIVRGNVTRVDVIASVCKWIRGELVRLGTTARIVDIPNGVPWETFQQAPRERADELLGLEEGSLVILSVGRHQRVKGFDLGLRAFARMAPDFPRAVYVLVGRDVSKLADLVSELGLGRRVRLVEELPQARLPALFHGSDVFFSPSLMEGFSQVNAQALACGLPLVLTDAPGNRDAGDDGGALIAESANVDSMAAALRTLVGDEGLRRKLSADARSAGMRYAWSTIASEYLDIFEELRAARARELR